MQIGTKFGRIKRLELMRKQNFLPQLIKLNGFDTGFGSITPKQWELTKKLSQVAKIS